MGTVVGGLEWHRQAWVRETTDKNSIFARLRKLVDRHVCRVKKAGG